MQNPPPSWRVLRRVSRWAILACAGWACLNPQPDTDPLEAAASGPGDSADLGPMVGPELAEGAAGGAGKGSGAAGGGGSAGSTSQAGSGGGAGSGSLLAPDAGDGGVPTGDAGVEVGDAGR